MAGGRELLERDPGCIDQLDRRELPEVERVDA
jgi:hypothetical protein